MCRAFVGFDLLYFTRLCSDILGVMENTTVVVLIYCLAQQRKNFESRPTFAKVTPKVKVACFFWLAVYDDDDFGPEWLVSSSWTRVRYILAHR